MRALTICQPYAELIMRGEKPIENREWYTAYRGPLVIHAGKSRTWLDDGDEQRYPGMPFGAIVGTAVLVACLEHRASAWPSMYKHLFDHEHANGPWCWILDRVTRFAEPIPYRGAQGLFEIPDAVLPLDPVFALPGDPQIAAPDGRPTTRGGE